MHWLSVMERGRNRRKSWGRAVGLALGLWLASLVPSWAEQVPASREAIRLTFAPVVKKAAPAVVNVYVRHRVRRSYHPLLDDPFFRRFFGGGFGLPRERVESSLGSGVIVSPEGIVVTNHHVIKGRGDASIKVALADRREFPADVILKDERTDLAVLRIRAPGVRFPYLTFRDSDTLEVGDLVLAIGNPFGVGQTVTSGIVSALARTQLGITDYQFFIQTDAAINPGNSGGALVDVDGKLVGINTAIYSKTGGSIGIGFAIPANMVRLVVRSALTEGRVVRPWFGAGLQAVSRDLAEALGLDRPAGALVTHVRPGSPAAEAGIRAGDVITAVGGRPVADPKAFAYRFTTRNLGGAVRLDVIRNGRKRQFQVALRAAPETVPRNVRLLRGYHPLAGARVANLSPALAEEISLDTDQGVVILDILPDSDAEAIGFRPHDIILRVNGRDVARVRDLIRRLKAWRGRGQITIKRGKRVVRLLIGG